MDLIGSIATAAWNFLSCCTKKAVVNEPRNASVRTHYENGVQDSGSHTLPHSQSPSTNSCQPATRSGRRVQSPSTGSHRPRSITPSHRRPPTPEQLRLLGESYQRQNDEAQKLHREEAEMMKLVITMMGKLNVKGAAIVNRQLDSTAKKMAKLKASKEAEFVKISIATMAQQLTILTKTMTKSLPSQSKH